MTKDKRDKDTSTQHYTENYRLSQMNPTKYRHEKTYSWASNMLYWRQKEIVDGKRIRNKGLYICTTWRWLGTPT